MVARQLPVEFGASVRCFARHDRAKLAPALVLCVGQAGGRARLSLERVAINIDDARIADNAGAAPVDAPHRRRRTRGLFRDAADQGDARPRCTMPASRREISQTAGTYVCNHVFYGLMHALALPARRARRLHPYPVCRRNRPPAIRARRACRCEAVVTALRHRS